MRVEVNETGNIILKEVYNGIGLESNNGETFDICMRDTGFEFNYDGTWYSAQKGVIKEIGREEEIAEIEHTSGNKDYENTKEK